MDDIQRGDIFFADLGSHLGAGYGGVRPVVIIQNNIANKHANSVIIAPATSKDIRISLPMHVQIRASDSDFERDSTILLEYIIVIDKKLLKGKVGKLRKEILLKIDKAICFSLDIDIHKLQKIEDAMLQISKPVVITEGKTDVLLIETAWGKLYPHKEMFFECIPSGIEIEKEERQGNAESVRRTIEYMANIIERPIIGLFDNDREGNEQFKGLNKRAFESFDIRNSLRKHKNSDCWGMLLPVPNERKAFVTDDDITQRYFVIEHYFSDDILKENLMYGKNILGTCVFKVNDKKDVFSKQVDKLDAKAFENFKILFTKIKDTFIIA